MGQSHQIDVYMLSVFVIVFVFVLVFVIEARRRKMGRRHPADVYMLLPDPISSHLRNFSPPSSALLRRRWKLRRQNCPKLV